MSHVISVAQAPKGLSFLSEIHQKGRAVALEVSPNVKSVPIASKRREQKTQKDGIGALNQADTQ